MSTIGGDVVTIAREADNGVVKAGRAKRVFNYSAPFSPSYKTKSCFMVPSIWLNLLEGEPPRSFLV